MGLKSKTEIFGIPYRIVYVKNSDVDTNRATSLWGQIDYAKREIRIGKDMSKRDQSLTLFEELVHGVLSELQYSDLNEEHKFITPFCNGLFTALERVGMIDVM